MSVPPPMLAIPPPSVMQSNTVDQINAGPTSIIHQTNIIAQNGPTMISGSQQPPQQPTILQQQVCNSNTFQLFPNIQQYIILSGNSHTVHSHTTDNADSFAPRKHDDTTTNTSEQCEYSSAKFNSGETRFIGSFTRSATRFSTFDTTSTEYSSTASMQNSLFLRH